MQIGGKNGPEDKARRAQERKDSEKARKAEKKALKQKRCPPTLRLILLHGLGGIVAMRLETFDLNYDLNMMIVRRRVRQRHLLKLAEQRQVKRRGVAAGRPACRGPAGYRGVIRIRFLPHSCQDGAGG